jgi:uncharacterized protein (TIGR02145 family)
MKKIISICSALLFAFTISMVQQVNAQDYLITFAGTGAATLVDSVEVENLTTGKIITLNGDDILRLTSVVGISQFESSNPSSMRIYPNPMMDNSILSLYPPIAGDAVITIYEMTGKTVAKIHTYLENSRQEFRLSGLKNGLYLINARGNSYQYLGKILCSGQTNGNPGIEKVSNTNESNIEKISKKEFNQTLATVDMYYTTGERLKFKAISGIYSTVKTDIPTEDKTLSFNFIPCTDGDNNNYPVVEIGPQTWMAINLKTTKYLNGDLIGTTTPDTLDISGEETPSYQWAYDGEESNSSVYGRLYTWFSVIDSRNICPTGWRVPNDVEWSALDDYLGGALYKIIETGSAHWKGPNLEATNETGFTYLPGGYRSIVGEFNGIGYGGRWWSSSETPDHKLGIFYPFSHFFPPLAYKESGFSVRCLRDLPSLTTLNATEITATSAVSGGDISNDLGYPITARGVCWSAHENPTIADGLVTNTSEVDSFTCLITGLTINTKYYVRAFATNSLGTAYGNEIMFATKGETGSVSDVDGNTYSTIEIGSQTWMAENLKTTKFNDGTAIPMITNNAAWQALSSPGFCWYNHDSASYDATYGVLFNWYTVNTSKLCPNGWHVPTEAEWTVLTDFHGGEGVAGGKLKEAGLVHWLDPNTDATNETGFTALPGGYRTPDRGFGGIGVDGSWWSSSEMDTGIGFIRYLYNDNSRLDSGGYEKSFGLSVRCLKDE